MAVLNWIKTIVGFLTLKPWRIRRESLKRRKHYDEIKALVVERHLEGFGGTILSKKYDAKDLACFPAPMYMLARTDKNEPVLCWRKELMTEEVGPPKPKVLVAKAPLEFTVPLVRGVSGEGH